MKTVKTILIALVVSVASISLANAQTRFHVSVNTPGVHVSAGNYHHYYHRGYYAPVYQRAYYPEYHHVYYRHYYSRPVYHHVYYRR